MLFDLEVRLGTVGFKRQSDVRWNLRIGFRATGVDAARKGPAGKWIA